MFYRRDLNEVANDSSIPWDWVLARLHYLPAYQGATQAVIADEQNPDTASKPRIRHSRAEYRAVTPEWMAAQSEEERAQAWRGLGVGT